MAGKRVIIFILLPKQTFHSSTLSEYNAYTNSKKGTWSQFSNLPVTCKMKPFKIICTWNVSLIAYKINLPVTCKMKPFKIICTWNVSLIAYKINDWIHHTHFFPYSDIINYENYWLLNSDIQSRIFWSWWHTFPFPGCLLIHLNTIKQRKQ